MAETLDLTVPAVPDKHGRVTHTEDMLPCTYLIRGVKPCKSRRGAGSSVCQNHEEAHLQRERQLCVLPQGARAGPEGRRELKRISSSQKRMYNPLGTPLVDAGCVGLPRPHGWAGFFSDPSLPLHIDIGSARGKFLLDLGERFGDRNFLGIEVREPLVREAEGCAKSTGRTNVRFVCGNLLNTAHLQQLDESLPTYPGKIVVVSVLFPDPWAKHKHRTRRVVQAAMLATLARAMAPAAHLVIASDVEDVVADAREKLAAMHEAFAPLPAGAVGVDGQGYALTNPFAPTASEREHVCEQFWRRVYRLVYARRE